MRPAKHNWTATPRIEVYGERIWNTVFECMYEAYSEAEDTDPSIATAQEAIGNCITRLRKQREGFDE